MITIPKTSPVLTTEHLEELEVLANEITNRESCSFAAEIQEVRSIAVELQEIPEESVADFNTLYSWINAHRSRVSTILMDINRERAAWKEYKYRVAQIYRKGKSYALTAQEYIIKLRNKELQEAAIQEALPEVIDLQELIKYRIDVLDDIEAVVEIKRDQINAANMDLSRQQRVIEILQGMNYPLQGQRKLIMKQGK